MSSMDTREGAFNIYVGTSGTRKTSDIKRILTAKRRNLVVPSGRSDTAWHEFKPLEWHVQQVPDEWRPGKMVARVIIPEIHTFTGTRLLYVDGKMPIFNALIDEVGGARDCRLVMDDFKNYIYSSGKLPHAVASLFKNRRHRMLDLFLACHSVEDINREMLALNPKLIIGYTTSMPTDTSIGKVANGEALLSTIEHANRVNAVRPEGERFLKYEVQM